MLNVQVEYAKHLENKRHNNRSEEIQQSNLDELRRHNYILEDQGYKNLQEVSRHNMKSEDQQDRQIAINQGHLDLSNRTLEENARHNLIMEQAAMQNAQASLQQAQAALKNASTQAQRAMYQNELDEASANLRRVESLQTFAQRDYYEAAKGNQKAQERYNNLQADFYDTQVLMRAIQSTSGLITPFMIGGK